MSNTNLLEKIDNKLRELGIPDLALESMNLDRFEKLIKKYEELEKENNDLKKEFKKKGGYQPIENPDTSNLPNVKTSVHNPN